MVDSHDPASGREVRVPVVSVRAPKMEFLGLQLDKVDKVACLRNLGAQVSTRPDELQAAKPIVEFDMVDRDLYGTMLNEGANKGILVCTSGYGPDAYNFSKDKPIELIDGGGLLYLLREHAGTAARIVV